MVNEGRMSELERVEANRNRMEKSKCEEVERLYDTYRRKRKRRMRRSEISMMVESESEEDIKNSNGVGCGCACACHAYGCISVIGRRRVMEDAVKMIPAFMQDYDFFAVYDGHAQFQESLHLLLQEELAAAHYTGLFHPPSLDWHKLMSSCFMRMDHQIININASSSTHTTHHLLFQQDIMINKYKIEASTAALLMVGRHELVVANSGDSRVLLCRGGLPIPLSRDRDLKPDQREPPSAAMKPFATSEPEVNVYERTEEDEFVVVASDGLWDVISNNLACEVVRRCLDGHMRRIFKEGFFRTAPAAEAAALLAELAMARGSKDNISVILVLLKHFT